MTYLARILVLKWLLQLKDLINIMLYIVKNINTNEISEQDIPQAFIDQLLEVGQEYNGFVKATQKEVDEFNNEQTNQALKDTKTAKKALVDTARDKWINETIINVPIESGIINLKIDLNTRNELMQINQGFIAGIITTANFGDVIDKTTKSITQTVILNYFSLVENALNHLTDGIYPKARIIKTQIENCKTFEEVENIIIGF